jgi:hypothetical protein
MANLLAPRFLKSVLAEYRKEAYIMTGVEERKIEGKIEGT